MEGEGFEQEVDTHEEWYQRVQPAVLSLPCKHSGFQSLDKYPPPLPITPPMCLPSADITPPRDKISQIATGSSQILKAAKASEQD